MTDESTITSAIGSSEITVTTKPSIFGRTRTFAGLDQLEWTFLVLSTLNILLCSGLTIYRLVIVITSNPESPDFTFTIVILTNAAFCAFYIIYGLLREKEFEIYAYCGAVSIIVLYCIAEYVTNAYGRNEIKLARLVLISVLGPANIVLGVWVAQKFGWLEFKIVGASEELQSMFKDASRFTSLLKFNLQLSVTFVILVLQDGTNATKFDIYAIAIGLPILCIVTFIGWISLRAEFKCGIAAFAILSLMQPAFVVYQIVVVYWHFHSQVSTTLLVTFLLTGFTTLLVDIILYYEIYRITRNFGKGLKERAFAVDEKTSLLAVSRRR